jgi:hypothetical protein
MLLKMVKSLVLLVVSKLGLNFFYWGDFFFMVKQFMALYSALPPQIISMVKIFLLYNSRPRNFNNNLMYYSSLSMP